MTAQPSADLEVYQPPALAVVPPAEGNDFDSWIAVAGQVVKLAREICDTPFVPDGLRGSAPAVAAAILAGRELGLPPITALQHTHVIKGKIGHTALLMRALIMSEGHDWQDVDVSDVRAVVKGRRKGEAEWAEASFTADQARRARIDLGGYPQDKLYARATVRLARRKFADVILGMPHAAEELEDGEVPGDIPAPAAEQNGNGHKPAAPAARTARRKTQAGQGTDKSGTAQRATGSLSGSESAKDRQPPAASPDLPPLPGEDEETPAAAVPDEQPASGPAAAAGLEPGEAAEFGTERHRKLIGIVRKSLVRFGYPDIKDETDEQRAARLEVTAKLAGVSEIGSSSDLDTGELSRVADALSLCKNADALKALLDAAQAQKAGDGGD